MVRAPRLAPPRACSGRTTRFGRGGPPSRCALRDSLRLTCRSSRVGNASVSGGNAEGGLGPPRSCDRQPLKLLDLLCCYELARIPPMDIGQKHAERTPALMQARSPSSSWCCVHLFDGRRQLSCLYSERDLVTGEKAHVVTGSFQFEHGGAARRGFAAASTIEARNGWTAKASRGAVGV